MLLVNISGNVVLANWWWPRSLLLLVLGVLEHVGDGLTLQLWLQSLHRWVILGSPHFLDWTGCLPSCHRWNRVEVFVWGLPSWLLLGLGWLLAPSQDVIGIWGVLGTSTPTSKLFIFKRLLVSLDRLSRMERLFWWHRSQQGGLRTSTLLLIHYVIVCLLNLGS